MRRSLIVLLIALLTGFCEKERHTLRHRRKIVDALTITTAEADYKIFDSDILTTSPVPPKTSPQHYGDICVNTAKYHCNKQGKCGKGVRGKCS